MSEAQFNPFDPTTYSNTPVEVPQEVEVPVEVSTEVETNVSSENANPTSFDNSVELPQTSNETVETENVSSFDFEWPNDVAKDIYEKLVSGNISELADMIYEQKVLSSLDTLGEADIIKLKMAYEYPDLTPQEIDEEFGSRFGIDNDVDTNMMTDDEIAAHNKRVDKQMKAVSREMKKEVRDAKDYLEGLKQDISFPDILSQVQNAQSRLSPDEVLNDFFTKQELEQSQAHEQARQAYVNSLDLGLNSFDGFSVNYKDEDVQFDGKYSLTPEEKANLSSSLKEFDLEEFYGNRYFKEGRYDSRQLAEDVYFLQNRDKVVNSLVTQAVSKAKSDLLRSMKNIDFNDSPRIAASSGNNDDYSAMVSRLYSL
jgi:hypothetical protein